MAHLLDVDLTLGEECARARLSDLRSAFAAEGLNIVLPLAAAAFDQACATSARADGQRRNSPAGDLVLVGDGGPTFFARFEAASANGETAHPLDDFTRTCVGRIVTSVLGGSGIPSQLFFPFSTPGEAPLPFQRLGRAAGLPEPGPLGLQVHPVFGPWWAYRALIATPLIFPREPALPASCGPCARPCLAGCAAHASSSSSANGSGCGDACGARARCPVGVEHRYPDAQLAFHALARERMMATLAAR